MRLKTEDKRTKDDALQILDIGTGSGCIPIALKKNIPSAEVSAIDVSTEALKVAQQNTQLNQVDVQFIEKDILQTDQLDAKYDIIVSNPPYVRELEKAEMKSNVLDNEPGLALFVEDDDPLIFYRKIAELAKMHLKENGILFLRSISIWEKKCWNCCVFWVFKTSCLKRTYLERIE